MANRISEYDDGSCPCCGGDMSPSSDTVKIIRQFIVLYGMTVEEIKQLEIHALNKGWKISITADFSTIGRSDAKIIFVLKKPLED